MKTELPEVVGDALFAHYLLQGISYYSEKNDIGRGTLIAALSYLCAVVFTDMTSLSIKEQCEEIDVFCDILKNHALKYAVRS